MAGCCCGQDEELMCQSCGMPLIEEAMFGTNKDGSKNEEWCAYCFKEGEFTEPDLTAEKMIKKGTEILVEHEGMKPEEAAGIMETVVYSLGRWKK